MPIDIVRAWKDDEYRSSLVEGEKPEDEKPEGEKAEGENPEGEDSEGETPEGENPETDTQIDIPSNPAGDLGEELNDKDLEKVQGGMWRSTNIYPQCATTDEPGCTADTYYPCAG